MSQTNLDVEPPQDAEHSSPIDRITAHEAEALRNQFSRTPRPYHHDGVQVRQDDRRPDSEPGDVSSARTAGDESSKDGDYKVAGWSKASGSEKFLQRPLGRRRRSGQPFREGSGPPDDESESGTEADDERPSTGFSRALPAPNLRPRKGLKSGENNEDALLTPSQLDDEGRRLSTASHDENYFSRTNINRANKHTASTRPSASDVRAEREKLQRRRFAEFLRRICEVALVGLIVASVLCGRGVAKIAWIWRWELLAHVLAVVVLVLAYPVKLSIVVDDIYDYHHHALLHSSILQPQQDDRTADRHDKKKANQKRWWQRFRVPASFDPATVLYPPFLPILVALSVAPAAGAGAGTVVMVNVILGLASLPQRLFPRSSRLGGINAVHWFVSIVPLIVSENTTYISKIAPPKPYMLKSGPPIGLAAETLVCLYPLHHALLQPLYYLTTTSLLISELHLLSVAVINLALLAESPQAVILKACLWIGGISLFITCHSVLSWNVTLARVPRWKLRRPGDVSKERRSLVDAVTELINFRKAVSALKGTGDVVGSDADEDAPSTSIKRKASDMPKLSTTDLASRSTSSNLEPKSAVEARYRADGFPSGPDISLQRRNTLPERGTSSKQHASHGKIRKSPISNLPWYLSLTPEQATHRKYLYASLAYLSIFTLVLGPVRIYISNDALNSHEPVTWALFYLFGQFREYSDRLIALAWLEPTISYIPPWDLNPIRIVFGTANFRLVMIAYWALVLGAGLLTVFSLTAYVEVDTRRKVFHGVMVGMFVPSLYFDPCFCALALGLALAVFLLLEVLRAAQVPPLGNAIGRFVAPYVDGRDLRGPVVVSHIFLLVGCAVPLWFSLACHARAGVAPWKGWEVAGNYRETAMLAGVVCVGMGDAAASLIGRRIGRHKWPWVGGKSFEGSAAFAVAVTGGLLVCKWWLVNCGWKDAGQTARFDAGLRVFVVEWGRALIKAAFCACAASFMEAVLTGANDNVVVPIVLWLLVKGVRL